METTAAKPKTGLAGLAITAASANMNAVIPEVPDGVKTFFFFAGIAVAVYAYVPYIYGRLAERYGSCVSTVVLLIVGAASGLGAWSLIRYWRSYTVSYTVCLSHDTEVEDGRLKVQQFHVETYLGNENNFDMPVELADAILVVGNPGAPAQANRMPRGGTKLPAHVLKDYGLADGVLFNPLIETGPIVGSMRYKLNFGKDASKPLTKSITIHGQITGAITGDGRGGAFTYLPDPDSEGKYNPESCEADEADYHVASKPAL